MKTTLHNLFEPVIFLSFITISKVHSFLSGSVASEDFLLLILIFYGVDNQSTLPLYFITVLLQWTLLKHSHNLTIIIKCMSCNLRGHKFTDCLYLYSYINIFLMKGKRLNSN